MLEVDSVEYLLIRVQSTSQGGKVANHLKWRNRLQCRQSALVMVKLDYEIKFLEINVITNGFEGCQYDCSRSSVLDLQDVREYLTQMFIIEHNKGN